MNKEHFLLVAGEAVSDKLDARRAEEVGPELSLVDWQVKVHGEGYRGAELVQSIRGWTLRHASGLEGFGIIASTGSFDFEHAAHIARSWQAVRPQYRYVFVRKFELEKQHRVHI